MMQGLLLTGIALGLIVSVPATSNQIVRVRRSELAKTSFTAGPLKITVPLFRPESGALKIEVENTSSEFATFDPRLISFVDRDNYQTNVFAFYLNVFNQHTFIADPRRIAPGARLKAQTYYITADSLDLPARLYYDDKLLGMIVDR
ncbi:MAG TPA: hypothetical protein VFV34_29325 [Blastocatellia bacterium]|nr:hypothetical protein [Blastocatellia bacterium]